MKAHGHNQGGNLQEFVDLLRGFKGVVEVKLVFEDGIAWIGLRTGGNSSAEPLLRQVSRAAAGFGLDAKTVHFGILAD
jgi:hypothetical protein